MPPQRLVPIVPETPAQPEDEGVGGGAVPGGDRSRRARLWQFFDAVSFFTHPLHSFRFRSWRCRSTNVLTGTMYGRRLGAVAAVSLVRLEISRRGTGRELSAVYLAQGRRRAAPMSPRPGA